MRSVFLFEFVEEGTRAHGGLAKLLCGELNPAPGLASGPADLQKLPCCLFREKRGPGWGS